MVINDFQRGKLPYFTPPPDERVARAEKKEREALREEVLAKAGRLGKRKRDLGEDEDDEEDDMDDERDTVPQTAVLPVGVSLADQDYGNLRGRTFDDGDGQTTMAAAEDREAEDGGTGLNNRDEQNDGGGEEDDEEEEVEEVAWEDLLSED